MGFQFHPFKGNQKKNIVINFFKYNKKIMIIHDGLIDFQKKNF